MFEVFVLVSWFAALLGTGSALLNSRARFNALGRSKGRWLAIQVAGFIPYLGIFTALAYVIMVRVHMEPRPQPERSEVSPGPGPSFPSGPAQQGPGRKVRCRRCQNGRVTCNRCGGDWLVRAKIFCGCQGGSNPCRICDGTGWVED